MKIAFGRLYEADMIHPKEYESARACQSNPAYDWASKNAAQIKKNVLDLPEEAGNWFPVNNLTCPRLYRLYLTALSRLGIQEEYLLFLKNGYDLTAQSFGSRSEGHLIVLNNACVDVLDDEELTALLGQQVGHILANHIQQKEMLSIIETSSQKIPVMGTLAGKAIWSYLAGWLITSQFTADRAALFASQSLRAVERLLLRQVGVDPRSPEGENALRQYVDRQTESLGIYFMKNFHSMPCFGNIERIAELRSWAFSDEMKKKYPHVYYQCRLEENDASRDKWDKAVLQLHAKAQAGDDDAVMKLAELYANGSDYLPASTAAAESLYRYASLHGNPVAMRILAGFIQRGINGLKTDEKRVEQLFRAAYSRRLKTNKPNPYPPLPVNANAEAITRTMMKKYGAGSLCDTDPRRVKDAFWIPFGDTVYACISHVGTDGGIYGLAVASTGLYGREKEDALPFLVNWSQFALNELYSCESDDGRWLFSGNVRLVRLPSPMNGTAAELIVLLKSGKGTA